MSYDVELIGDTCPTCGHIQDCSFELPEPTYNLTPIFHLALTGNPMPNQDVSEFQAVIFKTKTDSPRGLRVLNERSAYETEVTLEVALLRLKEVELFKPLEDPGGWGTVEQAVAVIERLLEAARLYPNLKWSIR